MIECEIDDSMQDKLLTMNNVSGALFYRAMLQTANRF
jgi:hypothetical protein